MIITEKIKFESRHKVISLSLFGSDDKYIYGSLMFVASAQKHLADWKIVFFVGASVPDSHLKQLQLLGVSIVRVWEPEGLSAMSWRFRTWHLGRPGWVIFRDADSLISLREASAVNQWVASERIAHIIRDHPFHSAPILGGLWGIRPLLTDWLEQEVKDFIFTDNYGTDQKFLAKIVYPKIVTSRLVHASFHAHEEESDLEEFQEGHSRFGVFCGESITSGVLTRGYARLRRLIDRKACTCER